MKYNATEIATAIGGRVCAGTDTAAVATYAFTDNREYDGGVGLFVAIKGARVDGHTFVKEMTSKGCLALIEDESFATAGAVLVDDTQKALEALAEYYRLNVISATTVVAVTGSVGKTGTKDMTALALSASKKVFKTPGNRNSNIGLPLTVLSVEPDTDIAVIEAGISNPDEMWRLSKACRPDVAIITNIGYSHIEAFGSREAIRDEKLQILSYMRENGTVIFNGDEPLLYGVIDKNHQRICCSLHNPGCCFRASNLVQTDEGQTFDLAFCSDNYKVSLSVNGAHYASDAMYAIAAAHALGLDMDAAIAKVAMFVTAGNRQKLIKHGDWWFIADYYNASPESMSAAIELLTNRPGRHVAVLGDMLELGSYAGELHTKVGEKCRECGVDLLITIGTESLAIAMAAQTECYSYKTDDFAGVADKLKNVLKPGDNVLFKGSNRMNLGEIIKLL